jgi:uncharacterized protein YaiL (DUF2058 family)
MRENRIKKLYVTEEQRKALLAGELSIAGYRRVHHIIPTSVADEIQALRDEIYVHRSGQPESELAQADDTPAPEAEEHAVPDDLVW